jgi:hypothetical protein
MSAGVIRICGMQQSVPVHIRQTQLEIERNVPSQKTQPSDMRRCDPFGGGRIPKVPLL